MLFSLMLSLPACSPVAAQHVSPDSIAPDSIFYDLADLDQLPSFPGGKPQWTEYVGEIVRRAAVIPAGNGSADIKMVFVIEKDGSISNKRVIWHRGPLLHIILGAIDQMPCWLPGLKNGQPVRVWYYLPMHICME